MEPAPTPCELALATKSAEETAISKFRQDFWSDATRHVNSAERHRTQGHISGFRPIYLYHNVRLSTQTGQELLQGTLRDFPSRSPSGESKEA